MNEEVDKQDQATPKDEPKGPMAGERLAAARRELQIPVHEIAKELHLDEPKVRALERNEFDVLGAPVFAKGHLKKYAQLVHVDVDDVLTDYYRLNRSAAMPPVVSVRPKPRQELSPGPWIAVIVVIIIAVSAYWLLTARPIASVETGMPPAVESGSADSAADELESTDAGDAAVQAPAQSPESAAETGRAIESSPEPIVEVAPDPVMAEGQLRLLITYSGDCWTEITDATGRRLFFGLGSDGRTVELSGARPFNVLFGNADNVTLLVDGNEFAIPASSRRGLTARLTIGAQ